MNIVTNHKRIHIQQDKPFKKLKPEKRTFESQSVIH